MYLNIVLLKLKSFKEAIDVLENVTSYLEHYGHIKEAIELRTTVDNIVNLLLKHTNDNRKIFSYQICYYYNYFSRE